MLPEVESLRTRGSLVRVPHGLDIPLSPRVRRLIDTEAMRRLASISQLGMVSLVYPGATHGRLEHSLGVYGNALQLLARFSADDAFRSLVDPAAAEALVLASLLHDVGHWPFCHPIEDMRLSGLGRHESRLARWLAAPEVAECLSTDWSASPASVLAVLGEGHCGDLVEATSTFLHSCLSGPIDVDKLDYLQRDSLHAGVPYGCHFDAGRLISSLCVHPTTPRLAVGEKGRTAAEMMVFARYVMFSEVYWHHTVRAATAMLQRAIFLLRDRFDLAGSLNLVDAPWIRLFRDAAAGTEAERLAEGLFGPRRLIYKRVAEFGVQDNAEIHRRLARRPYWWLVACAEALSEELARRLPADWRPEDLLIDAPPVQLEVDIDVDVVARDGRVRGLGDVSPVAAVLAREQFDNQVKRVRVFVRGSHREAFVDANRGRDLEEALLRTIDRLENQMA